MNRMLLSFASLFLILALLSTFAPSQVGLATAQERRTSLMGSAAMQQLLRGIASVLPTSSVAPGDAVPF